MVILPDTASESCARQRMIWCWRRRRAWRGNIPPPAQRLSTWSSAVRSCARGTPTGPASRPGVHDTSNMVPYSLIPRNVIQENIHKTTQRDTAISQLHITQKKTHSIPFLIVHFFFYMFCGMVSFFTLILLIFAEFIPGTPWRWEHKAETGTRTRPNR